MKWSKWKLTNSGEDNQGWIRFLDDGNGYESTNQIVFRKNDKWRLRSTPLGELPVFFPNSFREPVEAMRVAEKYTELDSLGFHRVRL